MEPIMFGGDTPMLILGLGDPFEPAPDRRYHRWKVTITYKTLAGSFDKVGFVEELDEIADIVEDGPDFYGVAGVAGINVVLANPSLLVALDA